MKKGEKYIIEIAEVHTHRDDNGKAYPIARIKGFSSLVFDQKGLDKLEKIEDTKPYEKKETYNCKFVVIENSKAIGLTVGKIYKLENGFFENDYGSTYPSSREPIVSFKDLMEYFGCDYDVDPVGILEIKE